ncbi:hypothetical protein STEG23_002206 [Scotinomys teguina]
MGKDKGKDKRSRERYGDSGPGHGIKVGNKVVEEEDMMVTMKKEVLEEVTMVAVGTIKILEIIVDCG